MEMHCIYCCNTLKKAEFESGICPICGASFDDKGNFFQAVFELNTRELEFFQDHIDATSNRIQVENIYRTDNERCVIGLGGYGVNFLTRMLSKKPVGTDYICVVAEEQFIKNIKQNYSAIYALQVGKKITHGLGCGALPMIGKKVIEASRDDIFNAISGYNQICVVCGLGASSSGAVVSLLDIIISMGKKVALFVTYPFRFEGRERKENADNAIAEVRKFTENIKIYKNDTLLQRASRNLKMSDILELLDLDICRDIELWLNNPYSSSYFSEKDAEPESKSSRLQNK